MDFDAKNALKRLESGEKIVGTADGRPFGGFRTGLFGVPDRTFLSTTTYKILKGSQNRTAIYYQYGRGDLEYVLYFLEDYGDTWAFSEEEFFQHLEALKTEISNMSLAEKVRLLHDFSLSGQDFFVPQKWRHHEDLIFNDLLEQATQIDAQRA